MSKKMLIHEYKESWVNDFEEIKGVLNDAFLGIDISIEHVGSTSVPQLAAKHIIDLDIIFGKKVRFEVIKNRLELIGYYHNGNQGILDREAFKRNEITVKHDVLDFIIHHLYACPSDSEELQRHLLFRDYLIGNEAARREYQKIKLEIAKEANQDKSKYAQLKEVKATNFINGIIEKAIRNAK